MPHASEVTHRPLLQSCEAVHVWSYTQLPALHRYTSLPEQNESPEMQFDSQAPARHEYPCKQVYWYTHAPPAQYQTSLPEQS
jgi:hypothetical protein